MRIAISLSLLAASLGILPALYTPHDDILAHIEKPQKQTIIPSTNALTLRSTNLTTTTLAPKIHPTFTHLSLLPPNPSHTAFLSAIYQTIYTTLTTTLTTHPLLEPLQQITITYGSLVLTIGVLYQTVGSGQLLQWALHLFEEVMFAMYPVAFSLIWPISLGIVFWAVGALDGRLVDAMGRLEREGRQGRG